MLDKLNPVKIPESQPTVDPEKTIHVELGENELGELANLFSGENNQTIVVGGEPGAEYSLVDQTDSSHIQANADLEASNVDGAVPVAKLEVADGAELKFDGRHEKPIQVDAQQDKDIAPTIVESQINSQPNEQKKWSPTLIDNTENREFIQRQMEAQDANRLQFERREKQLEAIKSQRVHNEKVLGISPNPNTNSWSERMHKKAEAELQAWREKHGIKPKTIPTREGEVGPMPEKIDFNQLVEDARQPQNLANLSEQFGKRITQLQQEHSTDKRVFEIGLSTSSASTVDGGQDTYLLILDDHDRPILRYTHGKLEQSADGQQIGTETTGYISADGIALWRQEFDFNNGIVGEKEAIGFVEVGPDGAEQNATLNNEDLPKARAAMAYGLAFMQVDEITGTGGWEPSRITVEEAMPYAPNSS